MPEGDTVHKIASYLAPRLTAQTLLAVRMADPVAARRCSGRQVHAVTARGKHLFIEFENATALRSHLGMYGSWHRYAKGEPWKKPRSRASLVLETENDDYVCFNASEVELVSSPSVRERIVRTRLGPDLISDAIEPGAIVRRARDILDDDALVADALLDQRVASGIGNVYKSELLFIERLSPELTMRAVSDEDLSRCYVLAAELLKRNLGGGKRVTRFENDDRGRLWVYGRDGQRCFVCGTAISYARLGRHHRSTYWCAACQ